MLTQVNLLAPLSDSRNGPVIAADSGADGLFAPREHLRRAGFAVCIDALYVRAFGHAGQVVAIVHLPLVSSATKAIYGRDYLAELPVRDYLARMAERPHVQRINADRKTSTAEMLARRK